MSKKLDRSNRKADLPDWADEVTPADEVMEKFYAPTGVFRHGPINTPREPAEVSPDLHIESGEDTTDPPSSAASGIGSVNSLYISAEDTNHRETGRPSTPEVGAATPPPTISPDNLIERSAPTTRPLTETTLNRVAETSADATLSNSQNILFAEFADKWKRYLYPGQLAVMRALYELTFPHETSECFTRYSEIAASTKMSRRNCINVMNSLVERGFVERLEIRNDATGKGIRLRIHLDPLR
jgi:DNA-binding MarR family transcriptional regulator